MRGLNYALRSHSGPLKRVHGPVQNSTKSDSKFKGSPNKLSRTPQLRQQHKMAFETFPTRFCLLLFSIAFHPSVAANDNIHETSIQPFSPTGHASHRRQLSTINSETPYGVGSYTLTYDIDSLSALCTTEKGVMSTQSATVELMACNDDCKLYLSPSNIQPGTKRYRWLIDMESMEPTESSFDPHTYTFPIKGGTGTDCFVSSTGGNCNNKYCTKQQYCEHGVESESNVPWWVYVGCLYSGTYATLKPSEHSSCYCFPSNNAQSIFSTFSGGTISAMTWDFQCTYSSCTSNYFFNANQCTTCTSGNGWVSASKTCEPCVAGRYQNQNDHNDVCKSCPIGYYAQVAGTVTCLACGAGQFNTATGSPRCASCTTGRYQNEQAQKKMHRLCAR